MRCTLSMLPYSNDLLKQSAMPLAAVVQPFAILDPSDDQTQVSNVCTVMMLTSADFLVPKLLALCYWQQAIVSLEHLSNTHDCCKTG